MNTPYPLTHGERVQIAEVLKDRANEIAMWESAFPPPLLPGPIKEARETL